jgi:hypothetical protein
MFSSPGIYREHLFTLSILPPIDLQTDFIYLKYMEAINTDIDDTSTLSTVCLLGGLRGGVDLFVLKRYWLDYVWG